MRQLSLAQFYKSRTLENDHVTHALFTGLQVGKCQRDLKTKQI